MATNVFPNRDEAIKYVREEKRKCNGVSTLCIFQNATGNTITYVEDHDWVGSIHDQYPTKVENGQWGAFLHTQSPNDAESVGAVVYSGLYNNTDSCNQLLGWDVTQKNHCYCNIAEAESPIDWDAVHRKMEDSTRQHNSKWRRMFTSTTIEAGTSPLFEAKLTIGTKVEAEAAAAAIALEEAKTAEAAGEVYAANGVVEAA